MKSILPLFSIVIILGSCTTAYKSGQTPDDVYYSPARPNEEYVGVEKDENRRYKNDEDEYTYNDDRYLRMKVRDRERWSYLDDYYRDPYAYRYGRNYYYIDNCYCNPRTYWNQYYNPYSPKVVYLRDKAPVYSKPRTYNLHVFDTPKSGTNTKTYGSDSKSYTTPRYTEPASNTGSNLRDVFRSGSGNSTKSSAPSSGSSSSGSSGSSGSSSNAPARKF